MQSPWAARHLPGRGERNAFYAEVGAAALPGPGLRARISALADVEAPEMLLARVAEAAAREERA